MSTSSLLTERDRFEQWWARPIEDLVKDERNGFAVLALTFPVLERYLREKSKTAEGKLRDPFYRELSNVVPELAPLPSPLQPSDFWHAYRNGLLHQATFSMQKENGTPVPGAWIKPWQSDVVGYDSAEGCFCINPAKFSERVLQRIRGDFSTFLGASSANHPTAVVMDTPPGAITGVLKRP